MSYTNGMERVTSDDGRVDLMVSWSDRNTMVDVQIDIANIPDGSNAIQKSFSTNQPDGECSPQENDQAPYNTIYEFYAPEGSNDTRSHTETFRYELTCRSHEVQVMVNGGGTSSAKAKALL